MTYFELFSNEPESWGFRGDPYLWREMKQFLADELVSIQDEELKNAVFRAFEKLTGKSIHINESICMQKYAHRGMSSGYISADFWRTRAISFLSNIKNET